jgi:hypothetical protein
VNVEARSWFLKLIAHYGTDIYKDPTKFKSLLNDYFKGKYKSERNVLVGSISAGVPERLLNNQGSIAYPTLRSQCIDLIQQEGYELKLAQWAVDTWAIGFNIIKKTDADEITGSINITSIPSDAKIYLDGILKGKTPLNLPAIPTGTHTLKCTLDFYQDWEKRIEIKPHEFSNFSVALMPKIVASPKPKTPTPAAQPSPVISSSGSIQPSIQPLSIRSPFLAIILSFFLPGWGQLYNGRTWDGLKLVGAFIGSYFLLAIFIGVTSSQSSAGIFVVISFVVLIGIWIYGMYDAYKTANEINNQKQKFSGKSRLFWLPVLIPIFIITSAVIAAFIFGMAGNVQTTKVVAATAYQQGNNIIITYQGGQDTNLVSKLKYGLGAVDHEWISPKVGDQVMISGATSSQDHVIVLAVFTDGSEQVILDTYV